MRSERIYDSFERSFSLPRDIDTENVAAHYENGILTITLPKSEEAKTKHIEVS